MCLYLSSSLRRRTSVRMLGLVHRLKRSILWNPYPVMCGNDILSVESRRHRSTLHLFEAHPCLFTTHRYLSAGSGLLGERHVVISLGCYSSSASEGRVAISSSRTTSCLRAAFSTRRTDS